MRLHKLFSRTIWVLILVTLVLVVVQSVAVFSQDEIKDEIKDEDPALVNDVRMYVDGLNTVNAYNLGGYASKLSVVPGESLDFHISTSSAFPMSLDIYREGAFRQLVHTIDNVYAGNYSCTGKSETGCDWPVALTFTVPLDWPTGAYTVDIPVNTGKPQKMIFWVRETVPGENGRILLLSSVNTYNAYNNFGGKSLYDFNSTDTQGSNIVSFDRPFLFFDRNTFYSWDGPFASWAEANGYPIAYATTYDVHYLPSLLSAYDIVVIAGHSEYYSWEMRQRIRQFINDGGRLVDISGNTMWRQVRFVDNGRTMIGYNPTKRDPVQAQTLTSGPNWTHPIYDVSFSINGTHWPFGGYQPTYGSENGGYWIQNANHWIFDGTGLQENDVIGRTSNPEEMAIHDYEADGMPFNCGADGSTILGPLGNSGTPHSFTILGMAPLLYPPKDMYNFAVMGIYTLSGGGAVFNAGTTGWTRALNDPVVDRVTRNILDQFLDANVPLEPQKTDTDFLFYDRFNCSKLNQGRFSSTTWLPTIHRFNYFHTVLTDANRLSDACGTDGSGLSMVLGRTRNGMSYQSMLKPNFGSINSVANSLYLNLANATLDEGSRFDLVQYYADNGIDAPTAGAVLQLGRQGGQTVMRFQPAGANLPWHVVPGSGFFKISTWWDQPNNQLVLWINDVAFLESANLSSFPAFNRADLGMGNAIGITGGSLCLDELKFDDQVLDNEPIPTPSPTPVGAASPAPTATATPGAVGACAPDPNNILSNPGFEVGTENWSFYTNGTGGFTAYAPAYQCDLSARVNIVNSGSNMQLRQSNFLLKANTTYRLSFAAYSNTGHDLSLKLHRHTSPYTNYGLTGETFDLSTSWQTFATEFTSIGFSGTTSDVRLRFVLNGLARNGDNYWIDDIRLEEVGGSPTATSTPSPIPSPTSTPTATDTTAPSPTPTPTPDSAATATNTPEPATATNTPVASSTPTATNTASAPTATNTPDVTGSCAPDPGNILSNPGFESGTENWSFYNNGTGGFDMSSPAFQCALAAQMNIVNSGSNMQFRQRGFTLNSGTNYRLTFAARSNSGNDLSIRIHKDKSPYTNYGLTTDPVDLSTSWQTYTTEFRSSGFSGTTSDVRLRFVLNGFAQDGDSYWIDAVRLEEVSDSPAATATATPLPSSTSTPAATDTPLASSTPTPTSDPAATATNTLTATNTAPAPTATSTPDVSGSCAPAPGNSLSNPGFESGTENWSFYSNGIGGFTVTAPAYQCESAARLNIVRTGSNMQFFQRNFPLKAGAAYRLSFAAYSTTGHDLTVKLHQQSAPYTNYGLDGELFDLGTSWQTFSTEFTTSGFSGTTSDVRLRFVLNSLARDGDNYWIDDVHLEEIPAASSLINLFSWLDGREPFANLPTMAPGEQDSAKPSLWRRILQTLELAVDQP